MNYYGSASKANYSLRTGFAPTVNEGGLIVKVADKEFLALNITGADGAGITLSNINIDTNLKTENCAVFCA